MPSLRKYAVIGYLYDKLLNCLRWGTGIIDVLGIWLGCVIIFYQKSEIWVFEIDTNILSYYRNVGLRILL